jgi:uncharacterized protein
VRQAETEGAKEGAKTKMRDNHVFLELKEIGDEGVFKGLASVYDIEDSYGDVIEKGAFTKTISENPNIPILWQHGSHDVIGMGTVKEWGQKITLDGRLDLEDPAGLHAYRKMKGNKARDIPPMVRGLSIGFSIPEGKWEPNQKTGGRTIREVKLWEVSVVTFPAMPAAQVTSVKNTEDLLARVERAEQEITALKAAKSTPEPEPVKAIEPPIEKSEEPGDHSHALFLIEKYKLGLAS